MNDLGLLNLKEEKNNNTLLIPKMIRDGRIEEVTEYLKQDLNLTKDLYEYGLRNEKIIYYKDKYKSEIEETSVNWKLKN